MKPFSSRPQIALCAAALGLVGAAFGMRPHRTVAQPPAVSAAQSAARYQNPVIDANFPDPSILRDNGTYYAYATNDGQTLPVAQSPDLVHWTRLPDAMPVLPAWVRPGRTWAPMVCARGAGKGYVAYFTGWDRAKDTQAVGVATSASPAGPFVSHDARPLIDQAEQGGSIDPFGFVDSDGKRYLLWKNDGNSRKQDTWLQIQRLSDDGLRLVGSPKRLIKQDQPWEGNLVEAPTLWKHGGKYYLFYSANGYGGCGYAIGYAVADKVEGPYVKPRSTPWLQSTPDVCGPGGQDIVTSGDGKTWMAYHEWRSEPRRARTMNLDPLVWTKDGPLLVGPSHWTQPAPVR